MPVKPAYAYYGLIAVGPLGNSVSLRLMLLKSEYGGCFGNGNPQRDCQTLRTKGPGPAQKAYVERLRWYQVPISFGAFSFLVAAPIGAIIAKMSTTDVGFCAGLVVAYFFPTAMISIRPTTNRLLSVFLP